MRKVSTYLSKTVWTETDIEFLTNNYIQLSHSELAERLSRKVGEVKNKIRRLELKLTPEQKLLKKQAAAFKMHQNKGIDKSWSQEELAYLQEYYPNTETKNVAAALGRTITAIVSKASRLKIQKTPEFLANMYAVLIPSTEGHRNFIRPSQSLSRAYVLVNVLHQKNTPANLLLWGSEIRFERERILTQRKNEVSKMVR